MRVEELEHCRVSAPVLTRKHFQRYKLLVTRFVISYENILKNNSLISSGTCSGGGQLCHSWLWCAKDPSSQPCQSSQCKNANIMNREMELPLFTDPIFRQLYEKLTCCRLDGRDVRRECAQSMSTMRTWLQSFPTLEYSVFGGRMCSRVSVTDNRSR